MYSIPFSHDLHSNWIAVGLFDQNDTCTKYERMYYGDEKNFKRKDFNRDIKPVVFRGSRFFYVEATCGTSHKPIIKVEFY